MPIFYKGRLGGGNPAASSEMGQMYFPLAPSTKDSLNPDSLGAWGPEDPHGLEDPGFPNASNSKLEAAGAGNPEIPQAQIKIKPNKTYSLKPQNQERAAE